LLILFEIRHQLRQLGRFALAHIQKLDNHLPPVLDGLNHAPEPERQPCRAKLNLDPRIDWNRESRIGAYAAASEAQFQSQSLQPGSAGDEADGGGGIDSLLKLYAAIGIREAQDLICWMRGGLKVLGAVCNCMDPKMFWS
jgi:hypothetical protein